MSKPMKSKQNVYKLYFVLNLCHHFCCHSSPESGLQVGNNQGITKGGHKRKLIEFMNLKTNVETEKYWKRNPIRP